MKLYKTIDHDNKIIADVKSGKYPNWKIVQEDAVSVEIEETK
jgi:hypothetical protein